MHNIKHFFIILAEVTLLALVVTVLALILPTFLGKPPIPYTQAVSTLQPTEQTYPYPPPLNPTLILETPLPPINITSTPTFDPTPTKLSENSTTAIPSPVETYTPLPLPTMAKDAEGEILFIDVHEALDTKLKKIDVDKDGKPKTSSSEIATDKLPDTNGSGAGQMGYVYPSPDGKKLFIMRLTEGPSYCVLDVPSGKIDADIREYDDIFGWHPDSQQFLVGDYRGLLLLDLNDKKEIPIVLSGEKIGHIKQAAFSPDGQKIIYSFMSSSFSPTEVWMVRADGRDTTKLFEMSGYITTFSWSPDGSKIALWNGGYWVMNADGTELRKLVELPGSGYSRNLPPLWSSDGTMLLTDVIDRDDFGNSDIFLVNIQNGEKRPLIPDGVKGNGHPTWSPDGRKVAFISTRNGKPDIWVANIDGSDLHQVSNEGNSIRDLIWRKTFPRRSGVP